MKGTRPPPSGAPKAAATRRGGGRPALPPARATPPPRRGPARSCRAPGGRPPRAEGDEGGPPPRPGPRALGDGPGSVRFGGRAGGGLARAVRQPRGGEPPQPLVSRVRATGRVGRRGADPHAGPRADDHTDVPAAAVGRARCAPAS